MNGETKPDGIMARLTGYYDPTRTIPDLASDDSWLALECAAWERDLRLIGLAIEVCPSEVNVTIKQALALGRMMMWRASYPEPTEDLRLIGLAIEWCPSEDLTIKQALALGRILADQDEDGVPTDAAWAQAKALLAAESGGAR